jgi:hypothetical protein
MQREIFVVDQHSAFVIVIYVIVIGNAERSMKMAVFWVVAPCKLL